MKVYISSTFQDLADHRQAVDRALRRMGHDVIGMEQYVAEGSKPLSRCQADVRAADAYVVIVAWRYGYVPQDPANPLHHSITELEYEAALGAKKPILAFLLDSEAPWPVGRIDALKAEPGAGDAISLFRAKLGSAYVVGTFRTPDDLASQVAAAIAAQGLTRHMVDRVLGQTSVSSDSMGNFGGGNPLDSNIPSIKQMVADAGTARAIVVDLGNGDQWWSTRLYLLASLLRSLTSVRQIVFRRMDGRFAGMASPAAIVDGLAAAFPLLDEFGRQIRNDASEDTQRETDRQVSTWNNLLQARANAMSPPTMDRTFYEGTVKVGVRTQLLESWLGERLVTRCIHVGPEGLVMTQVQQIVDSLIPDVPVERKIVVEAPAAPVPPTPLPTSPVVDEKTAIQIELQVVDRDAFALELAREWVLSGLPRNPVR